jgi:DNA-binding MarR family transcriptional regulator
MALSLKQSLEESTGKKAPGPSTTFSVFHLFLAMDLMAQKPIGRNKLAEKMLVGDGAIRTIIGRLKDMGLINIAKEGCSLTPKGQKTWHKIGAIFPQRVEILKNELTFSDFNYGFLVKNRGQIIKTGIEQRDMAIIAGAKSALIAVCKKGKLTVHSVTEDLQKDYPKAANIILKDLAPKENDVVIIASADSNLKAMNGAFAAAWSLVD